MGAPRDVDDETVGVKLPHRGLSNIEGLKVSASTASSNTLRGMPARSALCRYLARASSIGYRIGTALALKAQAARAAIELHDVPDHRRTCEIPDAKEADTMAVLARACLASNPEDQDATRECEAAEALARYWQLRLEAENLKADAIANLRATMLRVADLRGQQAHHFADAMVLLHGGPIARRHMDVAEAYRDLNLAEPGLKRVFA